MTTSHHRRPRRAPPEANCTYCGKPIRWKFHEEYAAWRSIDLFDIEEDNKEHECDPSEMLKTINMSNCENCGKLIRFKEGTVYELHFHPPDAVKHRCDETEKEEKERR